MTQTAALDHSSDLPDEEPREREQQYLKPLKGVPKRKEFVVFDLESKDENTQYPGFTRVFQVGFYDGKKYTSFRNEPHLAKTHWYERAISRGGCIDKFMRYLLGLDGKSRGPFAGMDCYAHNMGGFDGLFLPAWLERNNQSISYKIMPVQSRIQAFEVWRHNPRRFRGTLEAAKLADKADRKEYGSVRILDSFRILPSGLDKLAKSFGLAGKLSNFSLLTHEDSPDWETYNEIDCVQLYNILVKYYELIFDQLGGEVGITAPSSAIKLLRRRYIGEDDVPRILRNIHFKKCTYDHTCDGCAHAFFRSAYFGGRTEIFRRKLKAYYYDVNSSYPFSMTKPMPIGDMTELGENEDFTKYAEDANHIGFVRCTVHIPPDTYLPPLPRQMDGKLKFPAGTFSGTWDWVELDALSRVGGQILHVEKSVWIKGHPFLEKYVRDMYSMRQKDSLTYRGPALSEVAKLMMNSTFGKFGMDQDRREIKILKPGEEEPWEYRYPGESSDHREIRKRAEKKGDHTYHVSIPLPGESVAQFELRQIRERKGEFTNPWRTPGLSVSSGIYEHDSLVRVRDVRIDADYIIPQIAAHITAMSRVLLWSYAVEIHERGFKVGYCDTDSVLTDYPDFPESLVLGGLKKEYAEQVTIDAVAPKMYSLTKATPFPGVHVRPPHMPTDKKEWVDKSKLRSCLEFCPGCLRDEKGALVKNQHVTDDKGARLCVEKCPGCSCVKVMMKGVPAADRSIETMEKLQAGEEIAYDQHEKLGALARRGFRDTPRMQKITKSMRSVYDKRIMTADGNTKPLVIESERHLSMSFLQRTQQDPPTWLTLLLRPA